MAVRCAHKADSFIGTANVSLSLPWSDMSYQRLCTAPQWGLFHGGYIHPLLEFPVFPDPFPGRSSFCTAPHMMDGPSVTNAQSATTVSIIDVQFLWSIVSNNAVGNSSSLRTWRNKTKAQSETKWIGDCGLVHSEVESFLMMSDNNNLDCVLKGDQWPESTNKILYTWNNDL